MIDEKEKKANGQKNWLKEHDSIQVDLLKMKDELIVEDVKNETAAEEPTIPDPPRTPETIPVQKEKQDQTASSPQGNYQSEMTIKQMLGQAGEKKKVKQKEQSQKSPPKLEQGTIPSSPELTSKIASVLQLENKLKRRKFELEKRSSSKDVPPPPKKPRSIEGSAKERPSKTQDPDDPRKLKTEKIDPPKEPFTTPAEDEDDLTRKQIHIQSEKPYPKASTRGGTFNEEEGELIEEFEEIEEVVEEERPKKKRKRGILALFSRNK